MSEVHKLQITSCSCSSFQRPPSQPLLQLLLFLTYTHLPIILELVLVTQLISPVELADQPVELHEVQRHSHPIHHHQLPTVATNVATPLLANTPVLPPTALLLLAAVDELPDQSQHCQKGHEVDQLGYYDLELCPLIVHGLDAHGGC